MSVSLSVTGNNNQTIEFHFTDNELDHVKGLIKGRSTVPIILSSFQVVRTHSASMFAQDLLLPTVIQHAWKVNNIVLKIVAVAFAFALDLATLPIRLLRCIPRAVANSKQEEHPLLTLIKDKVSDNSFYARNHVVAKMTWREQETDPSINFLMGEVTTDQKEKTVNVNFIELHPHEDSGIFETRSKKVQWAD